MISGRCNGRSFALSREQAEWQILCCSLAPDEVKVRVIARCAAHSFLGVPMRMVAATAFFACLTLFSPSALAQDAGKIEFIDISKHIPKGDQTFIKVSGSESWQTSFRGKNIASITVTITGLRQSGFPELAVLQVVLAAKEDVPMSRNLAVRLLELNTDYDYIRASLNDESLLVRLDYPLAAIDAKRLDRLAESVAGAADAIFGEVKNFIP